MLIPFTRLAALPSRILRASLAMLLAASAPVSAGGESAQTLPIASKSTPPAAGPNLEITAASVRYLADLDLLVFEQKVRGKAGATVPEARGQLDGAPVLGFVFPTTLAPADVGFSGAEGTVALALTSHPDFDDTPLWDENGNRDYGDDGIVFHTHWVLLGADNRVPGGLAVQQFPAAEIAERLPPTHPGMPLYLDSPGFSAVLRGNTLRILVPAQRVGNRTDFRFDAVSAYMEVSQSPDTPMLGVYKVYGVLSGDLSLPYEVKHSKSR
ncbi:MAG: hypothetical protein AAF481_17375 [Acidobacteriota bacterium]